MIKSTWKMLSVLAFCGVMILAGPMSTRADEVSGPGLTSGNYIVTIDSESVNINTTQESQEVLMQAAKGSSFPVVEDMGDGWMKVKAKNTYGFLSVAGNATVTSASTETIAALEAAAAAEFNANDELRKSVVNYGLQFVGGRYAYGGSDPNSGVDCSGFTRYVLQHAAGVSLNRSSGGQATQGQAVSQDQMKPGDLIFYGSGRSINHVALYIGNGQIVHSSTYKTGIKVSTWNYRTPVKIVNVLGE